MKQILTLNDGWELKKNGDSLWIPAQVPGTVHTDLLNNEKISQPFYRNNEQDLQWIDKEDWIYRCTFRVDSSLSDFSKAVLSFKGLDTYAQIKLNGESILTADNMFRTWNAEITDLLLAGENELEIYFTSPITIGLEKLKALGYELPAVNDQSENGGLGDKKISVFSRKAPYHFGWDWGPRFVTSGIWREVKLTFTNLAQIENVYFKQNNILPEEASIDAIVNIEAIADGDYEITIVSPDKSKIYASSKMYLEQGGNSVTLPFKIPSPELWWPNGMGEQNLYTFKVELSNGTAILDTLSNRIGLRSVQLVREKDSLGTSFYFRVNGIPLFIKGANYIPNDNFLPRVSAEKYESIISSASEANMNMLRVWGGGIYENDIFYDLCDKYGLLVWQDFMFACSMYPGDEEFLSTVKQEAIDNIRRLRNHPSIALWCGNNEMDNAWCAADMDCGWSWKQQYNKKQRDEIWSAYDTLFHKILPDLVQTYDGIRDYWPSSPMADWGESSSYTTTSGDMHYWGVWHGQEPFSAFYQYIGRFMSEYGFQSFPDFNTIKKFTMPHDWDISSEVMMAHQRSGLGNARIVEYMEDLYPVPENFTDILYVGQILQAEGIKQAIHAHRANKPYCMGTLYWQLNDCWPSASWSSIDYYGSWKALHYYAKKAYEPVILAFIPDNDSVTIAACSDLNDIPQSAELHYSIRNFEGNILLEERIPFQLTGDKSTNVTSLVFKNIKEQFNTKEIYLDASISTSEEILTRDIYFFEPAKNLQLPLANIESEIKVAGNKIQIELATDKLARNVYLSTEQGNPHFSDNYFDLFPGEKITIECICEQGQELNIKDINIQYLNGLLPFNF